MNIQIRILPEPGDDRQIVRSVERGTVIMDLAKEYQKQVPYRILAARLEHRDVSLTKELLRDGTVTFLDMRDTAGNYAYQRSLSLLYLKAVYDTLGINEVQIDNSLNNGLFTKIKGGPALTDSQVAQVEQRMRELVSLDLPFEKEVYAREEGLAELERFGLKEKVRLLEGAPQVQRVPFYSLYGFKNFFYGLMVPSTGYLEYFELRRYRRGMLLRFPAQKKPDAVPEYRDDVKLYEAFGESMEWGRLMDIEYVQDLNQRVEDGSYRQIIQISEALHEKKIVELADAITKGKKRIVLIAGPSSSGKTTFAQRLCIQLRVNGLMPTYMGTDDYFLEREETPKDAKGEYNFEDIDAIDVGLFNRNMNDLLAGKTVDLPVFDFQTGKKKFGQRLTHMKPGQLIVIEGIHGLNRLMTESIPAEEKYKIYISPLTQLNIDNHNRIPTTDARMLRRIVRDSRFRGYSAQHTIRLWPKVREGENKNIFPFNGEADALFNSAHLYELAVLKKYALPLLTSIIPDEPEYSEAVRLLKFLQFFKSIDDDSIIANNSIMREFIGGSIFVE